MRIVYLGAGTSIHTIRWVRAIASRGHEVYFVTQHPLREPLPEAATVTRLPVGGPFGYLLNAWTLRRAVRRLKPDVVHVDYATGYGTLSRLSRHSVPTVLTVLGSDVHDFAARGRWARALVAGNLRGAQAITSASRAMAKAVLDLAPMARVIVVPFGVDTATFRPPAPDARTGSVVGTVKGLSPVYGIDILLRAFALLVQERDIPPARLVIAGGGPALADLEALADRLGIRHRVAFLGDVPHADVPALLGTFSLYVALSRRESFGVAVAEASACGLPVVVSRVGGLPEVVLDGTTGLIVPPENPEAAAAAIRSLLADAARARAMGHAGRAFVRTAFEWDSCVDRMIAVYAGIGPVDGGSAPAARGVAAPSPGISIQT